MMRRSPSKILLNFKSLQLLSTHLDTLFFQVDLQCELFAQHHIRIVGFLEGGFQLLQLFLRENRAMTSFPLRRRTVTQMSAMVRIVVRMMVVMGMC